MTLGDSQMDRIDELREAIGLARGVRKIPESTDETFLRLADDLPDPGVGWEA